MQTRLGVSILLAACAVACAGPAAASAALQPGEMIVYRAGDRVPDSDLVDLGPPENLGGTVLEGDPKISARVDYAENGLLAGVFQATRGTVLIHFPFTEHATVTDGEVKLTDQWGNSERLRRGDSYLIRQGSDILWEVRGARVQKSFFNRTEPSDSPAPMIVYKAHQAAGARIDLVDGSLTAGVFQATRGDARIRFPFTEHATVLDGAVTLTDETGRRERLGVGDSYLIAQDSSILREVRQRRVHASFLNVAR